MIEIDTINYRTPIYCINCGTETTDAKGSVVKCHHLVYVGHDEGVEFSLYDNVEEPEDEDEDEWNQYDEQLKEFRKKLDDEHLCIHITTPAPSGATYSIIYNLNDGATKNQQKSNENDWRETGE